RSQRFFQMIVTMYASSTLFTYTTLFRSESFQDLVSLFQKISPQAVMGLLTVPRAASGGPQPRLHGDEFFKPFAGSQLFHLRTARSEEHTSELQSQSNLVCRLLLEKKKK